MSSTILEALKELNEQFNKAHEHWYFNPDAVNITYAGQRQDDEVRQIHGHCISLHDFVKNFDDFELKEKMAQFELYLGMSEGEYIKAASELAMADAANYTDNSPHTGVECFVGNRNSKNNNDTNDYNYKIRWKSKYSNKQALSIIPGLFEKYNELYDNPSGEYCDVVIYKDNIRQKGEPEIVTFYCTTKENMLNNTESWKKYIDDDSVSDENLIDAKFIVIENKDDKGRLYSARLNPVTWRNIPNVIVVHPISVSNRKTDHGKKDGTKDDYFKYKKGYFIDSMNGDVRVDIDVSEDAGNTNGENAINTGSKKIGEARKIFEKAFWRKYAENRDFKYRKSTIENIPCFWANDGTEVTNKLRNDPKVREILYRWGLSEMDDADTFNSVINNLANKIYRKFQEK